MSSRQLSEQKDKGYGKGQQKKEEIMCTIGRISGGTARETYHCGNRKEGALRHGKEETDCGTQRCRSSFLNTTFTPMPPPELFSESPDGKPCNLITRENYEFLRDSFFRYALLMKKEAVHTPGRTPGESIARLHEEMCNLVGNDMNVNIEQDEERLLFRLWKCHEWGELTLYYFPTKFMERLGPELRRISVTFIHNLMQANGINTILDEDDMDYALTLMSEDDSGETASDRKKRRRLLHSYEEGRIHALLRRVERKSYYKNLPKAIDRYKPKDGYEQSLLSVMKEGLEFLTPEHGIMEYGYDPFYEEEPDFLPMYLSKQIRVIYDCTDMITEYLTDYYNSYSQETYDIIPVTTCDLSPETEELFRMDDYPERFFKWAEKFINITV